MRLHYSADVRTDPEWGAPADPGERWRAIAYLVTTGLVAVLVVLAIVFDQFAATGVLLVAFLSFFVAYLIAPATERLRKASSSRGGPRCRAGWPPW